MFFQWSIFCLFICLLMSFNNVRGRRGFLIEVQLRVDCRHSKPSVKSVFTDYTKDLDNSGPGARLARLVKPCG